MNVHGVVTLFPQLVTVIITTNLRWIC